MENQKAFFGHHKCGTTWIESIISQVCRYIGMNHIDFHSPRQYADDLPGYIEKNSIQFLSYTSSSMKIIRQFKPDKGFHVIRDPIDIVVSAYYSHLYSHPTDEWPERIVL